MSWCSYDYSVLRFSLVQEYPEVQIPQVVNARIQRYFSVVRTILLSSKYHFGQQHRVSFRKIADLRACLYMYLNGRGRSRPRCRPHIYICIDQQHIKVQLVEQRLSQQHRGLVSSIERFSQSHRKVYGQHREVQLQHREVWLVAEGASVSSIERFSLYHKEVQLVAQRGLVSILEIFFRNSADFRACLYMYLNG